MTTLTGHLSLYATQSLKSIDNWMNVVQGNIGGSLVTAYKQVEITYGGNTTTELKSPSTIKAGVMIGEQLLTTGNTRVDWRQGEIINSTQETHFAIQGEGFFLVQKLDASALPPNASSSGIVVTYSGITPSSTHGPAYLTRAGDFHWGKLPDDPNNTDADPNNDRLLLLNNDGMAVLADHGDGNHVFGPLSITDFNQIAANNPTFFRLRPSIVQPTYDTAISVTDDITATVDYDELKYSKYGSTILEFPTAINIKTLVEGSANLLDRRLATSPATDTLLVENALESSNVRTERNITELAVMGKIYNGFVQLIKVYNSNLDEVLGFIR